MSDRAEVEDVAGASDHQDVVDSASLHEGSKSEYQSDRGTEDAVEACVAADKAQQTYCFGASTITICHIWEMAELRYFADEAACAPGEETVSESRDDEVIFIEEFFTIGLCHTTKLKFLESH
jgi:hypothetical protein